MLKLFACVRTSLMSNIDFGGLFCGAVHSKDALMQRIWIISAFEFVNQIGLSRAPTLSPPTKAEPTPHRPPPLQCAFGERVSDYGAVAPLCVLFFNAFGIGGVCLLLPHVDVCTRWRLLCLESYLLLRGGFLLCVAVSKAGAARVSLLCGACLPQAYSFSCSALEASEF